MPWCPSCREEYESRVERCFDCDVALVDQLSGSPADASAGETDPTGRTGTPTSPSSAPPAAEDPQESEAAGDGDCILAADPETLAFLRQVLAALQVAYDEEPMVDPDETALWIRGGQALAVLRALDEEAFPIVREESPEGPRFRKHDPERDPDLLDPPVLKLGIGELRRGGREAIDALVAVASTAGKARREESLYLLGKLGEEGHEALVRLVVDRTLVGDERRTLATLRTLEDAGIRRRRLPELQEALRHPQVAVRRVAAVAAGRLGALGCAPELIALYEDADALVREEADDALTRLSGEDVGYDAEDDGASREACVGQRRRWWDAVRARVE